MIRDGSKDKDLRDRLLAVDLLRELKNRYTYKELSKLLGLQESLLCRYVNGSTVPSEQQARDLIGKVSQRGFLHRFFQDKIRKFPDSFIDTSELLHYPNMLKILLETHIAHFMHAEKVVGIASNGIPFATIVSTILDKPLIIVKKHKDSIYLTYVEENVKESDSVVASIYARRDFISKSDKILIVDDVMRSGKTLLSTSKLIKKAGATVIGALIIVAKRENINSVNEFPMEVVFDL
ncbi:Hypoxanthine/guanine phosphoribosyltransferase [Metallosphaera sp. J1]|uniref:phosphoribosyltransferase family protein n=1 Tax=Metallosphaera TaxID=41980 RepID=UPI001EDD187E|nr:phosphoribosyltransferase family protein [Metallosphaera javensis (ex Hofmann et al. 2022)]MCG3107845.1 Hypoxanthine/guanine phosphoribosyltransferase [Metallosphaera javensis (ex Hofmann et al. 2022)]BCS92002.1 MAG: hypoxanthine/guanine phosphoribosyltransferase [Metallosphaera javensis (ex Sakai et al. 2022)]